MPIETVRAEWVRDQVFLLTDRSGQPIVMTQPNGVNGADLLPLSVIGCAAWDIVSILHKQRQALSGLHVTAESIRDDEPPWRFRQIRITYRFGGRGLDARKIGRAIELAEQRYCSTHATVREAVALTSAYEIADEPAGPPPEVAVPSSAPAVQMVEQFNAALNAGDVDAMMRLMTADCVFENTAPPPDGARYEGQAAVRAFWLEFFRTSRRPHIEIEDVVAMGERCVMRWTYHWLDEQDRPGHVRGVDVYTLRDGLIAEKLSYVKG